MIELLRFLCGLLIRVLYRYRAFGTEVLQTPGPVLLVPNHTSWLDWLFLGVTLDRDWRFVVSRASAETSWIHRKIMIHSRTYPIDTDSPYGAKHMAEFLQHKGRLVLFAEGRISRTGRLMKLFDGTGFLLHKSGAKVITCYLRGAQRLPFSPNRERHRWFPRVSAHFSQVRTPPQVEHLGTSQSRLILTRWLRDHMIRQQFETEMKLGPATVPEAIVQSALQQPNHRVLGDVSNKFLTYRQLLTGAGLLGEVLAKTLMPGQDRVGILLPNVKATPVVLLALWSIGKIPAVLNYSSGAGVMLSCVQLAGLKQVITSHAFVKRVGLDLQPLAEAGIRFLWLEEIAVLGRKMAALLRAYLRPRSLIKEAPEADATAVIMFTSGSEGMPKGVELTHTNLLANIRQVLAVTDIQDWDCLFNALPLFHSFGLTVGTLIALVRGLRVFLYPSPLHYRQVPVAFYFSDSTILLATNTFLNGYARKAHPFDFQNLRYLFAGAEKVQESTARIWAERFGVRILEGYGVTECSPCLSVCTSMEPKPAAAGRFLPGIEYRLEPVAGISEGGRLLVRGPNVMRGYLNREANDAFRKCAGWYDTGDIAQVDEEGFVHILGRLKRFAKVSGEMISLTAIEDALAGAFPQHGLRCQVAVLSRPDEQKGERLVGVTNEPRLTLEEIRQAVRAKGFSNLSVPRELECVREIPLLGTGKVNHRELARMLARPQS
jgi:acyl-[acyl-carrier-protein]-phospholipid O-acyltransferase/long-chain-fatty-acid--[acyl-carrier-protein] ligase